MDGGQIAVVTMTLARDAEEERLLRHSLSTLAKFRFPILACDGGSPNEFVQFLRDSGIELVAPERPGLVGQIRTAIRAAAAKWPVLLYTEPDKRQFFETGLAGFLNRVTAGSQMGLGLAARRAAAFQTFPSAQREAESFLNHVAGELFGVTGDYCYGPFVFCSELAPELEQLEPGIGWGWRLHLFKRAFEKKMPIAHYELDAACPPEQLHETVADRIYRYRQLRQNLQALVG